jgi:hypothetical protein
MTYPANLPTRTSKKNNQNSKKYFSRKSFLLHSTLGLLFAGSWFIPANVLKTGFQSLPRTAQFNVPDEGVSPTPTLATAKQTIPLSPIVESSILQHPLKLGSIGLPSQMAAVSQRPIRVTRRKLSGVRFFLATVDLTHPSVFLNIGLPQNATQANSPKFTKGVEPFKRFVTRHPATVMVNGTFFSTDAQKRVMGNMVAGGRVLKYSPAENYGTTLGIRKGRRLELVTARTDGKPVWDQHWFPSPPDRACCDRAKFGLRPGPKALPIAG